MWAAGSAAHRGQPEQLADQHAAHGRQEEGRAKRAAQVRRRDLAEVHGHHDSRAAAAARGHAEGGDDASSSREALGCAVPARPIAMLCHPRRHTRTRTHTHITHMHIHTHMPHADAHARTTPRCHAGRAGEAFARPSGGERAVRGAFGARDARDDAPQQQQADRRRTRLWVAKVCGLRDRRRRGLSSQERNRLSAQTAIGRTGLMRGDGRWESPRLG